MAFYIQTNSPMWVVRISRTGTPVKVVANPFDSPAHFNITSAPINRKTMLAAQAAAHKQSLSLYDQKRVAHKDGK